MQVGISFLGSPADAFTLAREAEAAGADCFTAGEADHPAAATALAAALATTRLEVGTTVSLAFARSPTAAAMEAWGLASAAPGRCFYGLGPQVRQVIERRFSAAFDPPVARMSEYGEIVRRVLAACRGEQPEPFEGRLYQVSQFSFHAVGEPEIPAPPLYLGAVGPQMTALAAREFDGFVGHGLATPAYLEETVRPAVGDLPVTTAVMASLGDDLDAARYTARRLVAFYGTTPAYEPIFEIEGLAELPPRLRALFRERRMDEMIELVDDEIAARFVLTGTPDRIADQLERYRGLADRVVLGGVGVGSTREHVLDNTRRIMEVCRAYRGRHPA